MRLLLRSLPLLLLACGPKAPPQPPLWAGPVYGVTVGERQARLLPPPDAQAGEALPVVLVLGGYSFRSWELAEWMGLVDLARERRWILVIPEGSIDARGNPFWAATDTCCDWYGAGVDDVAFVREVVRRVRAEHPAAPDRLVVVGHSNGAFLGAALACTPGSGLTHLVSIGGSGFLDASRCEERGPLALLQVHGTADDVMPLDGDATAPGAREFVERWACAPLQDGALPAGIGAGTAWVDPQCPVSAWILDGIDHYPPLDGPLGPAIADWIDRTPPAPPR